MTRPDRIAEFTETIWDWYARHKRELPWRDLTLKDETERAYRILVSEVMLQQTQVSRVIIIYKRFLQEFPKLKDLAEASNRDVILAWRGMGYNSRALRGRLFDDQNSPVRWTSSYPFQVSATTPPRRSGTSLFIFPLPASKRISGECSTPRSSDRRRQMGRGRWGIVSY